MKKICTLVFMVVILFFIAIEANATTTLTIGRTMGANETINDGYNYYFDSQSLSNLNINLTYIKKIEISLEFQSGETNFYYMSRKVEFGNTKIGYPLWDGKNFVVFVTAGYLRYQREQISESQGFMTGADLIYVASDKLYLGLDFQYSLLGASYRRQFPIEREFPMDQISVKFKAQYIITDNLGLVATLHWLHFDANGGLIVEDILTPSLGVIYRF